MGGAGMTDQGPAAVSTANLPDGIRLCRGTEADLDAVVALEQSSFAEPWTRKMFQGELTGNPFARVLVVRESGAREGGEVLGYLCYWIVFDELRVMNLAIQAPWRRRGVATAMVRYAIRDARTAEATRALLEVRASNAAARALYQYVGFRETGVRKAYYRNPVEDAVLMEMNLLTEG